MKNAWLAEQEAKRPLSQPYQRLPAGHPDQDAEDMPYAWQRWAVEIIGALVFVGFLVAAMWFTRPLGPLLPRFLDWLTRLVS